MMFRTCTTQVNLDFSTEADMVEKMRIGLALQPLATALFANSPLSEGAPTGFVSTRSSVWEDVDNARCGNLPFVFQPGFGFERYVEHAMDVPMYFVYRDGRCARAHARASAAAGSGASAAAASAPLAPPPPASARSLNRHNTQSTHKNKTPHRYINALGQSWRDFMAGKLPALPGQRPTISDWANHLTTLFPEVRLKRFIEMRGADCGPRSMVLALPALWVGLLYDPAAQAECLSLVADWTQAERDALRTSCPRLGLRAPFRGGTVLPVARQVMAIARRGLEARGLGEALYLDPLDEIVASGLTLADRALAAHAGRWRGSVDAAFTEAAYSMY